MVHIDIKQARSSRLQHNENDMDQLAKFYESRYLLQVDAISKVDDK